MDDMIMPKPTGEYKVGTTVFTLTDDSRTEKLGPEAGNARRRIAVRLYYPVLPEEVEGRQKAVVMTAVKLNSLAKIYRMPIKDAKDMEGEVYLDASPVPCMKFPLIIFSHGMGSYLESNNLMLTELSSHGYVIAAIGHTYEEAATDLYDGSYAFFDKKCNEDMYSPKLRGTFAALKVMLNKKGTNEEQYSRFNAFQSRYCSFLLDRMEERAKDVKFVLDRVREKYEDRIDLSAGAGITGHSIGGATAYYVCRHDDEFKCGINLDGMLLGHYDGMRMKRPFYQISCDDSRSTVSRVTLDNDAPVYWELFNNMKHLGFSDMIFTVPVKMVVGKMDPVKYHEYVCRIHLSMFDKYLKGSDEAVYEPDDEYVRKLV